MATDLDRALSGYRSRPKDESGARKAKVSLVFDPKTAAFTDSDTYYQIGYQGFSELVSIEPRIAKFQKSVFDYSNSQIDPLFLTADENRELSEKVKSLLYIISDYCMNMATVKILEYLIQHYAVNRLHPDILILIALPYLETSLFVRIIQTIPFKAIPKEIKFLKVFSVIGETKSPINRTQLISWIIARPAILNWILSSANSISAFHPDGVFASFLGVLLSELAIQGGSDTINRSIVDNAIASIESPQGLLAVQYLMSLAALNEKFQLSESICVKITKGISKNSRVLFEHHYSSLFLSTVYFFKRAPQIKIKPDLVFSIASNISELKEICKKFDTTNLGRCVALCIATSQKNEELLRAGISILETSFFEPIAEEFIKEYANHYISNEYSNILIQKLTNDFPECLSNEILQVLEKSGIKVSLKRHTRQSIIDQLSESSKAAALFSDSELPYDIASSQAVQSLRAAELADSTDLIVPFFKYFNGRVTNEIQEFLLNHLFLSTSSEFLRVLNRSLSSETTGIFPYLIGIPDNNKDILLFLQDRVHQLPVSNSLPVCLVRVLHEKSENSIISLISLMPKNQIDFGTVQQLSDEIYNNQFSFLFDSDENKMALILAVLRKVCSDTVLSPKSLLTLMNVTDLKSLLPILSNIIKSDLQVLTSAFEISTSKNHVSRYNILSVFNIIMQKVNIFSIIPSLFISFLDHRLSEKSIEILRSIPLKEKEIKNVIPFLLKQSSLLQSDERTVCEVLNKCSSNSKNSEFFINCWNNINTASGAIQFFKGTHDKGIIGHISRFANDEYIADLYSIVIEFFNDNDDLKLWGLSTLNSEIIKLTIPHLNTKYLNDILPIVCAYPQYFSSSFSGFFKNQEPSGDDLAHYLRINENQRIIPGLSKEPPKIFKSGSFSSLVSELSKIPSIFSPAIILENVLSTNAVPSIGGIVPPLMDLLTSCEASSLLPLVFQCLNKCVEKHSQYIASKFKNIIGAISSTSVAHVHSSALKLIETLANRSPDTVAEHATTLFTSLSSTTLFADDQSNLQKIKQLLGTVLPILAKSGSILPLLDFLSKNVSQFSLDRASQIMHHSITCLAQNSYLVFESLLRNNQFDFALLISEQLSPEILMNSLVSLFEKCMIYDTLLEFLKQIRIPSLVVPFVRFFVVLNDKLDHTIFEQQLSLTCDSYPLPDFLAISKSALLNNSLSNLMQHIIVQRAEKEPSSQFVILLDPLSDLIKKRKELILTLDTLINVTSVLSSVNSQEMTSTIEIVLEGLDSDDFNIIMKTQALSFFSKAIEKFQVALIDVFPPVLSFASKFFSFVVKERIFDILPSSAASVCLLLQTSPGFSVDKIPDIMPNMMHPILIDDEQLRDQLIIPCLQIIIKKLQNEPLLHAFVKSFYEHKEHPSSLITIFRLFDKFLLELDAQKMRHLFDKINKLFLNSFDLRCGTWELMMEYQNAVVDAFSTFTNRLNEQLFGLVFGLDLKFFVSLSNQNQNDYIISRIFFVKAFGKVSSLLQTVFSKYYSSFIQFFVQFCNESTDSTEPEIELTIRIMEVFSSVSKYADSSFFDTDRFTMILNAIIKHGNRMLPDEQYVRIVFYLANAYANLMNATRNDMLWRTANRSLIEMMKSSSSIIKIASLKILDEAFKVVGTELIAILADTVPTLTELIEDKDHAVEIETRNTVRSIEGSVGESIQSFFQ